MKTVMFGCFGISILILVLTFCVYLNGYSTGNDHAKQINFTIYDMKFHGSDPMRLFWVKQTATDRMIEYIDQLDSISRVGYCHGVMNIHTELGLVTGGYVFQSKDTMRTGYFNLTSIK